MKYKDLELDEFQVKAIERVHDYHSIIVSAPTGSGKTLIADYVIEEAIKNGKKVIYTAPIKALSNQKFKDFKEDYGEDKIGLMTGDEVINPGADILVMTTEVYRNMTLTKTIENLYYVVFDEIHYINDIERGTVWEESIIFSSNDVRFVCLSATIPNAEEFASWISKIKEHEVEVIKHDKRSVPLKLSFYDEKLGITSLEKIKEAASIQDYHKVMRRRKKGQKPKRDENQPYHIHLLDKLQDKTPCLFFCFSRKKCEEYAFEYAKRFKTIDPEIKRFISNKLKDYNDIRKFQTAKILLHVLPKGIAFHHAGLLPKLKEIVEELFAQGKIKYLYATETFAVGINMPAKTVCFEGFRKFNGVSFGNMTSKEFFQMAGRAGRRGIDDVGYVIPMINRSFFSYNKIKKLTDKDTEPLISRYRLSVSAVLNLVHQHSDEEIEVILRNSFYTYQNKANYHDLSRRFKNIVKKMHKIKFLDDRKLTWEGRFASRLFVDEVMLTKIFATDKWKTLDFYQMILLITAVIYEPRRGTRIFHKHYSAIEKNLERKFRDILLDQVEYIKKLAPLIMIIFQSGDFFEMTKATSMLEGDLIRMFSQVTDRINQLANATQDKELKDRLLHCNGMIKDLFEDIS